MENLKIFEEKTLTRLLFEMDLPASFFKLEISPSSVLYHYNLHKPLDFVKVDKIAKCLSAVVHKKVKNKASDIASFCLSIPRENRAFPKFEEHHTVLAGKPAGEILFGVNERGIPITRNIRKTKSILIGGASGGGKSVYLSGLE